MDERNPYKPLTSLETGSYHVGDGGDRGAKRLLFAWVVVFVYNLPVPLFFGWWMTEKGGRIGMAIAVILFFAAGCWVCARLRKIGVFLIIGGIPVGLSQLIPVLQMAAGMVAIVIGHVVGLVNSEDATNELGGFLLTSITGAILMTLSAGTGFVILRFGILRFVLDHWGPRQKKSGEAGLLVTACVAPARGRQTAVRRITILKMMIGIALLAGLLSIFVPIATYIQGHQYLATLWQRADPMILGLRSLCPPGVNPSTWEESVTWTQIIGMNLYSTGNISNQEKERLNEDLAERLKGPVGPDIIPWLWSRYARMAKGTGFEGYVRGYRRLALVPLLSDAVRSARPITIPPASWNRAVEMTDTALASVIRPAPDSDPARHLAPEETDRFFDSLEELLGPGFVRGSLLGLWKRLAQAGPCSKQYVDREQPALLEVLEGSAR